MCYTITMKYCDIGKHPVEDNMAHIQGSYTRKSGEKVVRYSCRPCKALLVATYRHAV